MAGLIEDEALQSDIVVKGAENVAEARGVGIVTIMMYDEAMQYLVRGPHSVQVTR